MNTVFVLTRPINYGAFAALLADARRAHDGPPQIVTVNLTQPEEPAGKVIEALALLRVHDHRRHDDLTRSVDRVAIVGYKVRTQFLPKMRTVVLSARLVDAVSPDNIASVLAHEACHARLARMGVPYRLASKERVELLCLRNQVWFLDRLPSSATLAALTRRDYETAAHVARAR